MRTNSLKIPFIASIAFHTLTLFTIAYLLPSARDAEMDIIPIKILQIPLVENKLHDVPEPLSEKEIQKIKEELPPQIKEKIIEEPKINKVIEVPSSAPIEKEIKEAIVESPPPLIEETFEKPSQETPVVSKANLMIAESTESIPDETALKSEVTPPAPPLSKVVGYPSSGWGEGFGTATKSVTAASGEHAKTTGSKYGVEDSAGSANDEEMSMFRAMVRTKIERAKFYPLLARERGLEGVVGVRFIVHPNGGVSDIKVVKPCHGEILNKAAYEAIMKAAPFNPRPVDVANKEMIMEVNIIYRLN